MPSVCDHKETARSYVPEVKARVCVCVRCGKVLDFRKLREVELPGNSGSTGEPGASDERPRLPPPPAGAVCAEHGGSFKACDSGPGEAHRCTNSKWGTPPAVFEGPCRCQPCHYRPFEGTSGRA